MNTISLKRFRNYGWALLALAAGLGSCNKLLDIPTHPDDKLSDDRVYSDSANVMAALAGIYVNMGAGRAQQFFSGTVTSNTGMYADELEQTGVNAASNEFFSNELRPDNGELNFFWTSAYSGIYYVNAFLTGVTNNQNISANLQRQVRGEALVTRALYYFHLVNMFGPVPKITGINYHENAVIPQSPQDSIYNLIISDLTTAVDLLRTAYPSAGRARPNIQTARALLARVYLYRRQWKLAADMASAVISDNSYQLTDPDKTFLEGSVEAIWQLPAVINSSQLGEADIFVPSTTGNLPLYTLTPHLLQAFEANDKRQSMWTRAVVINGASYTYPFKYRNRLAASTPREALMLLRLPEQYLIRSEANARLSLLDTARADLNRIRLRAGLGSTPAVTQDQVLLAVEHERQTELFCELGQRWYDLKRTGRANNVLKPIKPKWQQTDTLFAIPLTQLQTNIRLDQNEGYF